MLARVLVGVPCGPVRGVEQRIPLLGRLLSQNREPDGPDGHALPVVRQARPHRAHLLLQPPRQLVVQVLRVARPHRVRIVRVASRRGQGQVPRQARGRATVRGGVPAPLRPRRRGVVLDPVRHVHRVRVRANGLDGPLDHVPAPRVELHRLLFHLLCHLRSPPLVCVCLHAVPLYAPSGVTSCCKRFSSSARGSVSAYVEGALPLRCPASRRDVTNSRSARSASCRAVRSAFKRWRSSSVISSPMSTVLGMSSWNFSPAGVTKRYPRARPCRARRNARAYPSR